VLLLLCVSGWCCGGGAAGRERRVERREGLLVTGAVAAAHPEQRPFVIPPVATGDAPGQPVSATVPAHLVVRLEAGLVVLQARQ